MIRGKQVNSASKQLQAALQVEENRSDSEADPLTDNEDDEDFRMEEDVPVAKNTPQICGRRAKVPPAPPAEEAAPNENATSADDIYQQLVANKVNVKKVVDTWVNSYMADQDEACRSLKNLIFRVAGCSDDVPADNWDDDLSDLVALMENDACTGPYPLVRRDQVSKKFSHLIVEFFAKLVAGAQYAILYDGVLLYQLTYFLGSLANSDVRALRHTGVFIALKLMTALTAQIRTIHDSLESTERTLDAERSREGPRSDRYRTIAAHVGTLKQQSAQLKQFIDDIIKMVVSHRYTDPCPEIRVLCIEEMGACILKNPQLCLVDSNLKYFFNNLADSSFQVKLATLKMINAIYGLEEFKHRLQLFTEKSAKFFVRLVNAPEEEIRIYSIRILTTIFDLYPDMLSDEDKDSLFELTVSNSALVATEAGNFVHLCYFSNAIDPNNNELDLMANLSLNDSTSESLLSPPRSHRSDRSNQRHQSKTAAALKSCIATAAEKQPSTATNSQCLYTLAKLINANQLNGDVPYVVDSLWESCYMLRDWTAMVHLLLNGGGEELGEMSPGSSPETISLVLVEILAAAVERATVGKATTRRDKPRQMKPDSATKQQNERRKLSEVLIPAFPLLLDRYTAVADKLEHILTLPEYFDMSIYTSSRLEGCMSETLRCLADVVQRHVDARVLEPASRVYGIFCNPKYSISARCVTPFDNLVESISQSFVIAMKELVAGNATVDWTYDENNRDLYQVLLSCLRKMAALFQFNDLTKHRLFRASTFLLKKASLRQLPFQLPEIVDAAARFSELFANKIRLDQFPRCSFMTLLWTIHQFSTTPDDEKKESLTTGTEKTVDYLVSILGIEEYRPVYEHAYTSLCNILLLFAPTIPNEKPAMESVVFRSNARVQDTIVSFISVQLRKWVTTDGGDVDTSSHASSGSSQKTERGRWLKLEKMRALFALLSNLVTVGQFEIRALVPMIRYYFLCSADFGDIFKALLVKCREMNQSETGKVIHDGLVSIYLGCMRDLRKEPYILTAPELVPAKKLAFALSQSFGVDVKKARECVKALHLAGITFVFNRKGRDDELSDLPYFDLLRYFTPKLLLVDRKFVKKEFDNAKKEVGEFRCSNGDALEALRAYERSLEPGDGENIPPPLSPSSSNCAQNLAIGQSPGLSSIRPSPSTVSDMGPPPPYEEGSEKKKRKTSGPQKVSTSFVGQKKVSLSFMSEWSTPPYTSTARGKGRKIVLGAPEDEDEATEPPAEDDDPPPYEPPAKASPAKRSRSISGLTPLKAALGAGPRTRSKSQALAKGQEDEGLDGFEPLPPEEGQDKENDNVEDNLTPPSESQDVLTLGDLSDNDRSVEAEEENQDENSDDYEIEEFSSDESEQEETDGDNIEEFSP